MVEQNAKKALEVGERGYILEGGKIKVEGKAERPAEERRGDQTLPGSVSNFGLRDFGLRH